MSQLNKEAKKERHQKLFEGQYHSAIGKLWFNFKRVCKALWNFIPSARKRGSEFMHPLQSWPAPKRLYMQMAMWNLLFVLITSLNTSPYTYAGPDAYQWQDLALEDSGTYLTNDEGYLIKSMPLEGTTVYDQNRVENVTYEVQSGDTLSLIAYRFGIKVSSIRYSNPALGNADFLKLGQKLTIPPKDGIYIKLANGDSLVKLIEKYKGNLDKTKEFNDLTEDSELIAGKEIFIVDGQPVVVPTNIASSNRGGGYKNAPSNYSNIPANPGGWVRPTEGIITTYFSPGHYALDIANRSQPPIWASAGGVVSKTNTGCGVRSYSCGGGYGNYILIDHGNGYVTRYAHLEELYVKPGDTVTQGQVIGKMGASGRVRGATGIHLHFEVIYNGTLVNPVSVGAW